MGTLEIAVTWLYPEIFYFLFPAILLVYLNYENITKTTPVQGTPPLVEGKLSFFLRSISNFIYAVNGAKVIHEGYTKFKGKPYQFMRGDGNVVMLSIDMIDELAALPSSTAISHPGLELDLLAPYTGFKVLSESRLHHTVIQRKLTPKIKELTPSLEEEISTTFKEIFPSCHEWMEVTPYKMLAIASARMAGRALVGPELCCNAAWLDTSINYTENVFMTASILRIFPTWLHPLLGPLMPSYWRCRRYVSAAKSILYPKALDLLRRSDDNSGVAESSKENNALTWLSDIAKSSDRDPELLAHLELILAFGSVHTTLVRMVGVLYDLVENPHCLSEVRDEISAVRQEGWDENAYNKLQKLDSVIRESQRMNPPGQLGVRRYFLKTHTFSNGVHIPKGTYCCLPISQIENDPAYVKDPQTFDGLRSYRLRQLEGEEYRHQFTSPDKTNLSFGYGKAACPGRFFASLMIKLLFVKLLTKYDIAFLPGQERPKNLYFHEFIFPKPSDKILIKRKNKGLCPF